MKRHSELRRTGPIARSPMKKSRRPARETIRVHGEAEFRAWMKQQPCAICGRVPSDAAHLTNGGMGRKDDVERTVPLCEDNPGTGYRGHHSEYDGGKRSFRAKYGDLRAEAAETHARWQAAA